MTCCQSSAYRFSPACSTASTACCRLCKCPPVSRYQPAIGSGAVNAALMPLPSSPCQTQPSRPLGCMASRQTDVADDPRPRRTREHTGCCCLRRATGRSLPSPDIRSASTYAARPEPTARAGMAEVITADLTNPRPSPNWSLAPTQPRGKSRASRLALQEAANCRQLAPEAVIRIHTADQKATMTGLIPTARGRHQPREASYDCADFGYLWSRSVSAATMAAALRWSAMTSKR